jgi:Flp pilus assembly protein TadG
VIGRRRGDRGSLAVEVVLLVPGVLMLLMLMIAGSRVVRAQAAVQNAAHDAARSYSLDFNSANAETAAEQSLDDSHVHCTSLSVDPPSGNAVPGGNVTVRVHCTISLSDLAFIEVGAKTFTASMTAPIDCYRAGQGQAVGCGGP